MANEVAEEWRVIPGVPGYEASSLGRIRRSVPPTSKKFGKTLVGRVNNAGYLYVSTSISNVNRSRYVHQLVALAFHGPKPPGMIVAHVDENKQNNAALNLTYKTPGDNLRQALDSGRFKPCHGEAHTYAKLTDEQVREIRRRAGAESHTALGREFGVARSAIYQIYHRRTWKHVA